MPRHNANRLLSFRNSQFSNDKSRDTQNIAAIPSSPLNDSINLLAFSNAIDGNHNTNKEDVILTDTSLSAMEFDDTDSIHSFATNTTSLISSREASIAHSSFSELSDALSQDNYNHLLSQPTNLHPNAQSMAPSRTQTELRNKLQMEWIAKDKEFNKWLKEKPSMAHITHFNDDLNGNKHNEYINFEFVWVKLKCSKAKSKRKRNKTRIHCCWWPAQISLDVDQETTANHKTITVQLCSSKTFDAQQKDTMQDHVFQFKRQRIIPFKHLLSQKNLKIFKYVVQYHLDPLLLTDYNLHLLLIKKRNRRKPEQNEEKVDIETNTNTQYNNVAEMPLKKRRRIFYREYKYAVRAAYDLYLKRDSKSAEVFHFNHCIHWIGDQSIRYKRAQIVIVKGCVLDIINTTSYKQDIMAISGQLWWPAVVVKKSYPHKDDSDAVLIHLIQLNIQCVYSRINIIPVTRHWLYTLPGGNAQIEDIRKLAEQMLLTAKCGYELHALFEKAVRKVSQCSFKKERCYHFKQWKQGYKTYTNGHKSKAKHKKKKKKSKKEKKLKKEHKVSSSTEQELKLIYGKPLTSMAMQSLMIHKKTNRNLWNFCNNKASFKRCIRNTFHPLQLSFYLKPPPQKMEQEDHIQQYRNAMHVLSKTCPLKKQRRRKRERIQATFTKNLRHRLYIRQNTEICSDVLYFDMKPLMIMSTNCSPIKLHNSLKHKYHSLSAYHHPRILARSSLLPSGSATKADLKRAKHRKGWFVIWYLRWIRLLQYHMQCRSYDCCIQIIALLLPVALREFNTFVHESEFIIKCTLFILNYMDDEYRRKKKENADNDIIHDNHHIHAIHNLLDTFHEEKHRGWKLSCLIGKYRFDRINERLDIQKITWFVKQKHFMSTQSKEVFRDKQHSSNCDIHFLSVLSALSYHKHYGIEGNEPQYSAEDIPSFINEDDSAKKQQNTVLESLRTRTMVSTRSRRRRIRYTGKRKRRSWNDAQIQPLKRQKLTILEDDYAADAEDDDDDADDEHVVEEMDEDEDEDEVPSIQASEMEQDIEVKEDNEWNLDINQWRKIMNTLEKCFRLNPLNDCYLFFMFQLLSHYKPADLSNKMMLNVYNYIKRFIELQTNHPNGYRYAITFLCKYSECVPQTTEMILQKILDYLVQLIFIDPLSRCICASFHEINNNDEYIEIIQQNAHFRIQFMYVKLLSIMNAIELGDNALNKSKWKQLRKICREIQHELSVFDEEQMQCQVMQTLHGILSLISDKNTYWKFTYFNSEIFRDATRKCVDSKILSLKLKCCLMLYGNKHSFMDGVMMKQKNTKCIRDLCVETIDKYKENEIVLDQVLDYRKKSKEVLHYGKVCVFEPVIICSPYNLQYSPYCDVLQMWKTFQNRQDIKGMHYDRCTPWNDSYKHQLFKYKKSVLQQFNHEMRTLYFMQFQSVLIGSEKAPKSKLIDSCWILMKKLNQIDKYASNIEIPHNHNFEEWNERMLTIFNLQK